VIVARNALRRRTSFYAVIKRSGGCLSHPPLKNYVGKRFGMLTVLEYAGKRDVDASLALSVDSGKESIVGQTLYKAARLKAAVNGYPQWKI
jgi:hypothetical protein